MFEYAKMRRGRDSAFILKGEGRRSFFSNNAIAKVLSSILI